MTRDYTIAVVLATAMLYREAMNVEALREQARQWMESDPDPQMRAATATLLSDDSPESLRELRECFEAPLAFGTAGLRGILGPGPGRMNRATVRRVSAGLAQYVLDMVPGARERGVVIGHDARVGSAEFAADAAAVFCAAGLRVFCCPPLAPTPLVAFALRSMHAAIGIVVTASHNPREYNGYKVYWEDGIQIVPPHDHGIAAAIAAVDPATISLETDGIEPTPSTLKKAYREAILTQIAHVVPPTPRPLRLVYTPLHGVGAPLCEAILRDAGVEVLTVPEQREPDGQFPTVSFPNPEEEGAMDRAAALANAEGVDLVLGNDPDADRLAVMVRVGGELRALTGDDVGAVLGSALLGVYSPARNRTDKAFVATTIVSSELLARIARHHHADCIETLTGFKWLWNASLEREASGGRFVMCYEEALGYCVGTAVRDKDGLGAALLVARLAQSDFSIWERLEDVWTRHGYMTTRQRSLEDSAPGGQERMADSVQRLRDRRMEALGDVPVVRTRDLMHGGSGLSPTNCMTWWLADGSRIIVRPSGTEPKLKIYFQVCEVYDQHAADRASTRLEGLESEFLRVLARR